MSARPPDKERGGPLPKGRPKVSPPSQTTRSIPERSDHERDGKPRWPGTAVEHVLDRTTDLSLSHLEYRVLMYVAYRLDETGLLDLSPQRLARDCGRNRTTAARSVRRALVRLEAMGLIDELRDGRFSTNPARASDGKQGP